MFEDWQIDCQDFEGHIFLVCRLQDVSLILTGRFPLPPHPLQCRSLDASAAIVALIAGLYKYARTTGFIPKSVTRTFNCRCFFLHMASCASLFVARDQMQEPRCSMSTPFICSQQVLSQAS